VLASAIIGGAAGLAFVRMSHMLPAPTVNRSSVAMSLLAFIVICSLKPSTVNHHLVGVALYFSGRDQPYRWTRHFDTCAARQPGTLHGPSKTALHIQG
jgi:hypothetical protein